MIPCLLCAAAGGVITMPVVVLAWLAVRTGRRLARSADAIAALECTAEWFEMYDGPE